jgi:hypothetical protein
MNAMEAAKKRNVCLLWIVSALLVCAPALASSASVSHLKTRAEVSPENGQFSVEPPALSPVTASSYYDWLEEVASESSVAPVRGTLSPGEILRQKYSHYTPLQRQARIAELADGNRILREAGVPRQYISEALQSFEPGTITSRVAGDADFGLRFYGGTSGPRSPYLSPTFPLGNVRQLSAPPPGNTLEHLIQYQIRPGTTILEGRVRAAFGQPGGGRQIYVPGFMNNLLPGS